MRAVKRELLFFALIGVLFFVATGINAFNTEQNYSGEDPDRVAPGHLSLGERLGYAIIVNAGYGTIDVIPASASPDHTPHFTVTEQAKPELDCTTNALGEATQQAPEGSGLQNLSNPKALVEAILAAEKYNRGPLQRVLESAAAHSALALTGHVPEMSLGLGQVKPSVARAVLPPEELAIMSEPELLDYLLDDCSSTYVASAYVAALLRAEPADRPVAEVIADVAAQYNGAGNTAYVSAVSAAFRFLTHSDSGAPPDDSAAAPPKDALRLCAVFGTGLPDGRILLPGPDAAVPVNQAARLVLGTAQSVSVAMNQWEPGPKSYLLRLSQLRLDWTDKTLRELGVPADLPLKQENGSSAAACAIAADYKPRASLGLITVTLPPGTLIPDAAPAPADSQ